MQSLRDIYKELCESPEKLESRSSSACTVDIEDIFGSMRTHAEDFRVWSQLSVLAQHDLAKLKAQTEVLWADCRARSMEQLSKDGEKSTKDRVDDLTLRDQAYQKGLAVLHDAEKRAGLFKSVEQAMWMRKDMLQSMNARQCKELSSIQG